jgi:17beta-estradiol 17-dehydrogenase / very-long-chain 3-oxoacyl-CoA reductase
MGVVGVKYAIGEAATEYWVLLVLAAIGFLYVLRLISLFLPWIYVTFLRPGKSLSRYGDWALITGATDGIGKAFTGKLAKKKINLVIVGRSQPKLEELAKELHSKYGVEVGVLLL